MMRKLSTLSLGIAVLAANVYGTNGMNMEGYGARSTALGGAGIALDTGTAAPINNPATMLLMKKDARLDVALNRLGPDVSAEVPDYAWAKSASDQFFMPAMGYLKKNGNHAFGVAVYGQGGMGTEYAGSSFLGLGRDLENMTEVSVGRLMFPYAYQLNEKFGIGGSIDYVWAGMDLRMAMSGEQLMDLANPLSQQSGQASGSLLQALDGMTPEFAYFDFANDNKFTGDAMGRGYAANIGVIYDASSDLRFGAVYHTPTKLADLESSAARVTVGASSPMGYMEMALDGNVSVVDFQWPASYGIGVQYSPALRWRMVADVKRVEWSDVMDSFRMSFVASDAPTNGPMAGMDLNSELYQRWNDQTVYSVGLEYATAERGAYRIGFNHASNPIPSNYLNPLFPATVEDHITFGSEHSLGLKSSISWSGVIGLNNRVANPAYGIVSEHGQYNFQIVYSRFWGE